VTTVSVTVGQTVQKGDVLAAADSTAAQLQLTSAQATLASAQAKLATDSGGPSALTKAQASNSLSQSKNSYSQAVANRKTTNQQNALSLSQAKAAVTAAQTKLAGDAGGPGTEPYDTDAAALAQAQSNLNSTQLKVNQSNQQASQQVTNASLSLKAAELQYDNNTAPASSATVTADQAQVAAAQATVNADQLAVTDATILAPQDGLIVAVNILPGVSAPSSGYAIEESVDPMVATASFTESDISNLKVGQAAVVDVTAPNLTVNGTVTQIVPTASTSGGASSVVTYAVIVTLTDPQATVLSGMSATVTVTTATVNNAVRVPATALEGSAAAGYSVQVENNGSVTTQAVQVGLVTTSYVQITSGLSEGDTVVVGTTTTRNSTTTTGGSSVSILGGTGVGGAGGFTGGGGFGGR
jgi:multidrug efflux pump subunit AcrA (membrane-fusion protein)